MSYTFDKKRVQSEQYKLEKQGIMFTNAQHPMLC